MVNGERLPHSSGNDGVAPRRMRPLAFALAVIGCTPAPQVVPAVTPPVPRVARAASWSDSVLASLSRRDKAAQLVWPMVFGDFTPTASSAWGRAQGYVATEHVGGIVMSVGSPTEIAEKLNAEKVPTIHGTNRWTAASVRKAFVS